jgi:hypothetical protein
MSSKFQTPPLSGVFLASRFAIFASVFVTPMPIETGIPVACFTSARISRA